MERVSLEESDVVEAVPDVHLAQLAGGESMSVQHFRIDPGATVPEHSHHHEQAGFVYRGELTFVLADGEEVHGAENRGDEPVEGVDIFSPPRPNPDWAE